MSGSIERFIDRNPDPTRSKPVDLLDYEAVDRFTLMRQAEVLEQWLRRPEFDGHYVQFTSVNENGGMEIAVLPLSPDHRIKVIEIMAHEWQENRRATGLWWCIVPPGSLTAGNVHVAEWLTR